MKPTVEITIPVYNEEDALEASVRELRSFLRSSFPYPTGIVIADNASVDGTERIGRALAAELPEVSYVRLEQKGRGRALRHVWSRSDADVVCYMDVDLSTGLDALLPLVAPLISGHSDIAIGTRLATGSRVVRGAKREFISRTYNKILQLTLRAKFSDAQCGFKAVRTETAKRLLPEIEDQAWFFDTELLVLGQRRGLRIHEVPVDWVDDPNSSVNIVRTAVDDLLGVARLQGELIRFGAVGVASTIAYLVLFLGMRVAVPAQVANALALGLSAIGNTAANRRFTFGRRGRHRLMRHHAQGLFVFGLCLGLTSASLALLSLLAPGASTAVEVAVLIVANALATLLRYLLLRLWVFGPGGEPAPDEEASTGASLAGHRPAQALPSGELQGLRVWASSREGTPRG